MNPERQVGIRLCEELGFFQTAEVIRSGECYPKIMRTLAEEAGINQAIESLAKEENPRWIFRFVYDVHGLSTEQINVLVDVICESNNPAWIIFFAGATPGLSQEQRNRLHTSK